MLGVSGLWAADLALSPLRGLPRPRSTLQSRSADFLPVPLRFFYVPLTLRSYAMELTVSG